MSGRKRVLTVDIGTGDILLFESDRMISTPVFALAPSDGVLVTRTRVRLRGLPGNDE